ncbi:rhomboid family intramembrane serine protease [Hahella ganghwensis]|uniref:rhomboid family intramembrane serine protease n=1 Tax=Hahella ganghwensis TaxID=286420 RepID=UPI0003603771|nr:rhomboid family intramembrane serine protease [Hahella ganghwensis]
MNTLWSRTKIIMWLAIIMIVVHFANIMLNFQLLRYGIRPHVVESLPGIFAAPFLHGGLDHLFNNLIGFAIFSWLCLLRSLKLYLWSSLFIITCSGLLVWLFGRPSIHIGASGWIFGLWSLSIALAWFNRSALNIFIALVVVFLYGGMIYGVLPSDPRVSFEAHLFGALSGIGAAWLSTIFRKEPK